MFRYSSSALKLYGKCGSSSKYLDKNKGIVVRFFAARESRESNDTKKSNHGAKAAFLLLVGGVVSYCSLDEEKRRFFRERFAVYAKQQQDTITKSAGDHRVDLPTYTMQQVSEHDSDAKGIWVAYREGVYDITNFVKKHPGGTGKIMMAAGGSIDPFWMVFSNHNNSEILELLESMRIGNLNSADVYRASEDTFDPYALEPTRSRLLKANGKKPFCAEPPAPLLVESFKTPTDIFYVRNHMPVPLIDAEDYELEFTIEDETIKTLKLDDVKKFPKHTVTAAIMCGGNRRSEMNEAKPLRGLSWSVGAVGNASWSGARLCDVLNGLGVKEEDYEHVQFEGMDVDPSGVPYGASIPISRALDPRSDVLLAYEMNGEVISLDHGYPLRVVVPGCVGARNVKWVNKIILSKDESFSQFQRNDYKGFSPSTDWDTVDFTKSPSMQEMPVTSAICVPQKGERVTVNKDGTITVKGYAWSGGGRKIIRVDVTADEGQTWHVADLVAQDTQATEGRHYAWTIWSLNLPVDKAKGSVEIWTKAVDSSYNVQPESFKNIWNLRGLLCNAYHRVKVDLK